MDQTHTLALCVLTSYFLAIIGLFTLILRSLAARPTQTDVAGSVLGFKLLTLGSFAHTWFYMFKFMHWSFTNYERGLPASPTVPLIERTASWLVNTALFEQAWAAVCFDPLNWLWSEQLCVYTVGAWTVFLVTEGRARNIKHVWAYMLLGQLVAISVASNLFYIALLLSPPTTKSTTPSRAPFNLTLSTLLALGAVAYTPATAHTDSFLPTLLTMHALSFLPLFSAPTSTKFALPTKYLYTLIGLVGLALRARSIAVGIISLSGALPASLATLFAFCALIVLLPGPVPTSSILLTFIVTAASVTFLVPDLAEALPLLARRTFRVLHAHPAQSSIGWDIVWTGTSTIAWALLRPVGPDDKKKRASAWSTAALTLPVGAGVTGAIVFRES